MFITQFVMFLVIGLAAGWLAGYLTRGNGFGLVGNLIVGACGSLIGGFLFSLIPVFVRELILATVGALLFLTIMGYVIPRLRKRKQKRRTTRKR
jgi:uncharacterized membrane protein YeaQ/YmgE (transglycosylase-associated protein family)